MPFGGYPVGGGVQATDKMGGTHLPGATEGTGLVQVVQGGDGGGVFGGGKYDTSWAIGRGNMGMENLGHRGRSVDVSHGLPVQGRPAELPDGGMPRTSGDKDSNAGPFPAPSCPGHSVHFVVGKPPPTMVPPMQHDIPPGVH